MARGEEAYKIDALLPSAARTTGGQGDSFDLGEYNNAIIYLDITAAGGTSPTLDVKLQTSHDGQTWFDLPNGAFSQKTGTGKDVLQVGSNFGRYVRVDFAIGGSSPSFTFTINAVSKN